MGDTINPEGMDGHTERWLPPLSCLGREEQVNSAMGLGPSTCGVARDAEVQVGQLLVGQPRQDV